jgi:hypothetical protein
MHVCHRIVCTMLGVRCLELLTAAQSRSSARSLALPVQPSTPSFYIMDGNTSDHRDATRVIRRSSRYRDLEAGKPAAERIGALLGVRALHLRQPETARTLSGLQERMAKEGWTQSVSRKASSLNGVSRPRTVMDQPVLQEDRKSLSHRSIALLILLIVRLWARVSWLVRTMLAAERSQLHAMTCCTGEAISSSVRAWYTHTAGAIILIG